VVGPACGFVWPSVGRLPLSSQSACTLGQGFVGRGALCPTDLIQELADSGCGGCAPAGPVVVRTVGRLVGGLFLSQVPVGVVGVGSGGFLSTVSLARRHGLVGGDVVPVAGRRRLLNGDRAGTVARARFMPRSRP